MGKKIAANGGCVLLFPERLKNNRRPAIISGPEKTRLGWAEEWIQIQLDIIELEVRKEGDNVATLENDLRCAVVAKATVQISEADLEQSLPKLVTRFRCSTTTDTTHVLNERFFKGPLTAKFKRVVEKIIGGALYEKLLQDASYHDGLRQQFEQEFKPELEDCGFRLVSCEIRFTPMKPDDAVLGPEMLRIRQKWQDWEIEKSRFDVQFEAKRKALSDEGEENTLKRKEQNG